MSLKGLDASTIQQAFYLPALRKLTLQHLCLSKKNLRKNKIYGPLSSVEDLCIVDSHVEDIWIATMIARCNKLVKLCLNAIRKGGMAIDYDLIMSTLTRHNQTLEVINIDFLDGVCWHDRYLESF